MSLWRKGRWGNRPSSRSPTALGFLKTTPPSKKLIMTDTNKECPQYPAKEGLTMPGDPAVVVGDRGHPSGEATREDSAAMPTQVAQESKPTGESTGENGENGEEKQVYRSKWSRISWRQRKSSITAGMSIAEKEKFWAKLKTEVDTGKFELKRLETEAFDNFEKLIIHQELLHNGHIEQDVFDQFIKTRKMTSGACAGLTSEESKAFWDDLWEKVVAGTFHEDLFKNFTKTQRKSFERKVRLNGYTLPFWKESDLSPEMAGEKRKGSDGADEPSKKKQKAEEGSPFFADPGPFHVIFCHDKRTPLLPKHFDYVKKTLTDLCASEDEDLRPTIEEFKTVSSQFLVVCANKDSMFWVLKQKVPTVDDQRIHSYRTKVLDSKRVKIGIKIPPDVNRTPHVVIKRLGIQNPQLRTNTWSLTYSANQKLVNAFIPLPAVDELEKLSWRPYFELGRLVAYIVRTKTTPEMEQILKKYNNVQKKVLNVSKDFVTFSEFNPDEPPFGQMMPPPDRPFFDQYDEVLDMQRAGDLRVTVWNTGVMKHRGNGDYQDYRRNEGFNPWMQEPDKPSYGMNVRDRLGPQIPQVQGMKPTLSSRFGENSRYSSPRGMDMDRYPQNPWAEEPLMRSVRNPPSLMQDIPPRMPQMYNRSGRPSPWAGQR